MKELMENAINNGYDEDNFDEYLEVRRKAIEDAESRYVSDDISIDEDAKISDGDDGVWVQAWVFVPA